jgi:hypothetical protein
MPVIALILLLSFASTARADLADKLSRLVGYVIVDAKTIKGWYDESEKEDGAFKGCKHGRVIVFTDNKALTCAEFGYQYAYRPTAIILAKSITYQGSTIYDYKMVVGDDIYDMRR